MKLKGKTKKGIHYNCPVLYCFFITSSAANFYSHLKLAHHFMEFSDRK